MKVEDYEVIIPGFEQMEGHEQRMVQNIAQRIIEALGELNHPASIIDVEEFNRTEAKISWQMVLVKLVEGSNCSELGLRAYGGLVFETVGRQDYEAINSENDAENYDGTIKIGIKLLAAYSLEKQCHTADEKIAFKILRQAYMIYYEEILKYYSEWTTKYLNAPIYTSVPLEHV